MSKNKIVVSVRDTNRFTDNNLDMNGKLVVPEAFPELYGEDLMDSFVYAGRYLVEMSDIQWESNQQNTQVARAGGGNPKYTEIKQDISDNGFKLKHPPIALRRLKDNSLVPLNGRTRKQILAEFKFKNIIADIYERDTDYSWDKFDDDSSKFGEIANAGHDPAGNLMLEDVYRECIHAIQKGWIDNDIAEITARVNQVCGKGKFTQAKRDEIVLRVYNHYRESDEFQVLSWKSPSSIKTWLESKGYIDDDNVIYYPVSHSTPSKGITGAAKMAFDTPGKEIRVIVHTSVLTAFDLERCYIKRVKEFVMEWENILQKISSGYFAGKVRTNSPIKLFGAMPAISTLHGLDEIVTFKSIDKEAVRLDKEAEERTLYGEGYEFDEEFE